MPTIEDIPVWTMLPDWATEIVARYEWLTSVVSSPTQAEQRRALRVFPRCTLDLSYVLYDRERAAFDLMLSYGVSRDWYVPLPYEIGRLSAPLSAGGTTIPFAKADREIKAPGFVLLLGSDFRTYEVISVESAAPSTLTISPAVNPWPAGTRLFPLRKGRIIDSVRTVRTTTRAGRAQLRFLFTEPLSWEGLVSLTPYADYPVWDFVPNEIEAIDFTWGRATDELDNDTAIPVRRDLTDLAYTTQSFRWFLRGRAQHAAFLDLLHFLRGRQTPFWISTYSRDLFLAEPVAEDSDILPVVDAGYVRFGGPVEGKDHIEIRLIDGSVYRRKILSAEVGDPGVELLTLDSAVTSELNPSDVSRISFLRLARLDQDAIEIAHSSDTAGVARASTAIRSVRENRDGPDWTPVPFDNVEMIDAACGTDGTPHLWAMNANGVFSFGYTTVEAFNPATGEQIKFVDFVNGGTARGMTSFGGRIYHTHSASGNIGIFSAVNGANLGGKAMGQGILRQLAYDGKYIWAGYNNEPQKLLRLTRNLAIVDSVDFSGPSGVVDVSQQIDGFVVINRYVLLCRRNIGAGASTTRFHLYNTRGQLVHMDFIVASGRHTGVAYDGQFIYTSNPDNDLIYRWNPDSGEAVDSFLPENPYSTARAPVSLSFIYQ